MLQGPGKPEASTPVAEEKENTFSSFDADKTVDETSIVNESYENSSSWESYESGQEAVETSADKYSAIARLDDQLEDEKWEERTAVITSADHQDYFHAAASILQDVLAEVKTPVKA